MSNPLCVFKLYHYLVLDIFVKLFIVLLCIMEYYVVMIVATLHNRQQQIQELCEINIQLQLDWFQVLLLVL